MSGRAAWRDAGEVDFETLPIRDRPRHPPVPVGLALRIPGRKPTYYAWGHPTGNTHTFEQARGALGELYESGRPLLFHNAKFDREVAEVRLGMPALPWNRYYDTLPALFLKDPRAPDFALKSSAERILGRQPEERDALVDWLMQHQPVRGVKLSSSKGNQKGLYAGGFTAFAPVEVARPYALEDLSLTRGLAEAVFPELERRGMWSAYDRERQLLPLILRMERQGLRIDLAALTRDLVRYEEELERIGAWLRQRLGASAELNIDSGDELSQALIASGLADADDFGVTPTGKMKTSKDALAGAVSDPQVLGMLRHRTQLHTCLKTYLRTWLEEATGSGGYVYTTWNSTRVNRGKDVMGARTGRLSASLFMNMPKEYDPVFGAELPAPIKLLPLPAVRRYVLPYEDGEVLIDRDYSQQELRVLAHFENGPLMAAYQADPWIDFHDTVREQLKALGIDLPRKPVKIINLGLVYGMGAPLLASKIGRSVEETRVIKSAILSLYPGIKELYDIAKQRAKEALPVRTWAGREYLCEEPKYDPKHKRWMTFDYKLPNAVIQGSSADITKQAMLNFEEARDPSWRVLLTVHDQLTASVPRRDRDRAMECLRAAMESIQLDVPLLSEGKWSAANWDELEDYDLKGKRVAA